MASSRAQAVAEVLWELKQANKLGTLSRVARRAGFSPGSNGKTIANVLDGVRREWPHLQWWRVVRDDGLLIDSAQVRYLTGIGVNVEVDGAGKGSVLVDETLIMIWTDEGDPAPARAAVGE
ncbi:MAG: hypothetical protein KF774_17365 [Planctomyces sp.]|nr:hypothetical protein [Planctomyces sp.]